MNASIKGERRAALMAYWGVLSGSRDTLYTQIRALTTLSWVSIFLVYFFLEISNLRTKEIWRSNGHYMWLWWNLIGISELLLPRHHIILFHLLMETDLSKAVSLLELQSVTHIYCALVWLLRDPLFSRRHMHPSSRSVGLTHPCLIDK